MCAVSSCKARVHAREGSFRRAATRDSRRIREEVYKFTNTKFGSKRRKAVYEIDLELDPDGGDAVELPLPGQLRAVQPQRCQHRGI